MNETKKMNEINNTDKPHKQDTTSHISRSRNRKANKSIVGCGISIFWAGAMAFGFPGVMSTYWQEQFGVGSAETGAVVTFMLLALAAAMFFSGKVHMAIGMKKCIGIGLLLYIISMILLLNASSIYMVYLWGFIANLGCSFIYGPGLTTAQQWFPHKRGLASGILNLLFGIAAGVMSPIWNPILNKMGAEFLIFSIIAVIAVSDIIAMIITTDPTHARFTNEEEAAHKALLVQGMKKSSNTQKTDLTVGQAMKTKDFWIIWFVWAFAGAAGISMVSLAKSYAIVLGIASVTILTVFNLFNGTVRIIVGYLTDIIGGEITAIIAFVLSAVGYLVLPHTDNIVLISLCAGCVGIGFGTLFTVSGPIISNRFGLTYFGLIFGIVFTAYGIIGGIAGPALAGKILEITGGSYIPVFTYLAVFSLIGAALMLVLLVRRKRRA